MVRYSLPILLMLLVAAACAVEHPVFPVSLDEDQQETLRRAVEPVMQMSEQEMLDFIPTQAGLYFVGCLNCTGGQQDNQMRNGWSIEEPDVARCVYCDHVYPSDDYPTTGVLEVTTPAGNVARYPYHEGRPHWWNEDEPFRSFFHARVDYHKIRYMESAAAQLARFHAQTGEEQFGRRAALILHRFAEVYPDYVYKYDYPFRQRIFYDGEVDPADFLGGYRTSRWTWWAYMDISRLLLEAYDLLAPTGVLDEIAAERSVDAEGQIREMFVAMTEQVIANPDGLHNMSPGMWADFIRSGRILGEPEYVHVAVNRVRRQVTEQFFYDGVWVEGAPSYHSQVVGGLTHVFRAATGYSDPPGYVNEATGERFDDLDIEGDIPEVTRARDALMRMRLPDGRFSPVHDTWWTNRRAARDESYPDLLGGLGHAILGTGAGEDQVHAHLTWSPGYGHRHYDGLDLLLWANGHELLSDIGYTHTAWREWTVQSPGHNLVVVDQANQVADSTTYGDLRYFAPGETIHVVSVDNPQVYPGVTDIYRRTVALVELEGAGSYLLDLFRVAGGDVHDYLLHGSADIEQTLAADVAVAPRGSLVPEGVDFVHGRNEQDFNRTPGWAYGYMSDLHATTVADRRIVRLDYRNVEDAVGLQVHTLCAPGDELVLGQNPSVRQAGNDDRLLDQYHRQFSMIRRAGGDSLFASVITPFEDAPPVGRIGLVEIAGAELALEIALEGRTDLVLVDAAGVDAEWNGRRLQADGELMILTVSDGGAVAGMAVGDLAWGEVSLQSAPAIDLPLLAVERSAAGGDLRVAGEFQPPAGTVITVDHGGERTSPYTVVSASVEGGETVLQVEEDPGFEYDAAAEASTFIFMPRATYEGPHTVNLLPVAHMSPGH